MVPTGDDALEHALDELYGVDPSEFTATRTRLATDIRATDTAASKTVKAARRPTTAAWAMNRMSRDTPALVEGLLARSAELRAAETGGRDALRDATRAQRDALAAATDAAMAALGDRATEAFRAQVRATLHAASVDDEVAELLRRGRLTKEASGVSGFPESPGLTLVPPLPPERAAAKPKTPPGARRPTKSREAEPPPAPDDAAARQAAEAEARERAAAVEERARRELEAAEAAVTRAEEAAATAEQARDAAHEVARRLETDLERARRDARAADTAAARARREATRIAREATRLAARRTGDEIGE